jgi:hypothetical protein
MAPTTGFAAFVEGLQKSGGDQRLLSILENQKAAQNQERLALAQQYWTDTEGYLKDQTALAGKIATKDPQAAQGIYKTLGQVRALRTQLWKDPEATQAKINALMSGDVTVGEQGTPATPDVVSPGDVTSPGGIVTPGTPATPAKTYSQADIAKLGRQADLGAARQNAGIESLSKQAATVIAGNYNPAVKQAAQDWLDGKSDSTEWATNSQTRTFTVDDLKAAYDGGKWDTAASAYNYLKGQGQDVSAFDLTRIEAGAARQRRIENNQDTLLDQAVTKGGLDIQTGKFNLEKAQGEWEIAKRGDAYARANTLSTWAGLGNVEALEDESIKAEVIKERGQAYYDGLLARARTNRTALDEQRSADLAGTKAGTAATEAGTKSVNLANNFTEKTQAALIDATNAKNNLTTRADKAALGLVDVKTVADRNGFLTEIAKSGEVGKGTLDEMLKRGDISQREYDGAIKAATQAATQAQAATDQAVGTATLTGLNVTFTRDTLTALTAATNAKNTLEERTADAQKGLVNLKTTAERAEYLAVIASKGELGKPVLEAMLKSGEIGQKEYDGALKAADTAARTSAAALATAEGNATLTGFNVTLTRNTIDRVIKATNSTNDLTVRVNDAKGGLLEVQTASERAEYLAQIAAKGEVGQGTLKGMLDKDLISKSEYDAAVEASKRAVRRDVAATTTAETAAESGTLSLALRKAVQPSEIRAAIAQNEYTTESATLLKEKLPLMDAKDFYGSLSDAAKAGNLGYLASPEVQAELARRGVTKDSPEVKSYFTLASARADAELGELTASLAQSDLTAAQAKQAAKLLPLSTAEQRSAFLTNIARRPGGAKALDGLLAQGAITKDQATVYKGEALSAEHDLELERNDAGLASAAKKVDLWADPDFKLADVKPADLKAAADGLGITEGALKGYITLKQDAAKKARAAQEALQRLATAKTEAEIAKAKAEVTRTQAEARAAETNAVANLLSAQASKTNAAANATSSAASMLNAQTNAATAPTNAKANLISANASQTSANASATNAQTAKQNADATTPGTKAYEAAKSNELKTAKAYLDQAAKARTAANNRRNPRGSDGVLVQASPADLAAADALDAQAGQYENAASGVYAKYGMVTPVGTNPAAVNQPDGATTPPPASPPPAASIGKNGSNYVVEGVTITPSGATFINQKLAQWGSLTPGERDGMIASVAAYLKVDNPTAKRVLNSVAQSGGLK